MSIEDTEAEGSVGRPECTTELDAISLEQALVDFEVANARVLDLTRRLTVMAKELLVTKSELERVRLTVRDAEARRLDAEAHRDDALARMGAIESSRPYRLAMVAARVKARALQ